jgi:hypothetical protein
MGVATRKLRDMTRARKIYKKCAKKRQFKKPYRAGEDSPRAKLTNTQADDIRCHAANGEKRKVLALEFNVSRSIITKIVLGLTYYAHRSDALESNLSVDSIGLKENGTVA